MDEADRILNMDFEEEVDDVIYIGLIVAELILAIITCII